MLKIVEQTVRDYCTLSTSDLASEKLLWEEARDFIYDDSYTISWGELDLLIEEFLDAINIDIEWFREQTTKKFKNRNK